MTWDHRNRSDRQRILRERRNERAYLFDQDFSRCLGEVNREDWESAISFNGGNVAEAAKECGLDNIPRGAKVLWGRSADEALGTYRRWQKQKRK